MLIFHFLDFIDKIYDLALESYKIDEIPVGAIIVRNDEIVFFEKGIEGRIKIDKFILI